MTDLNKIKDKIARQHGYKDWFHMVSSKLGPYIPFDEVVEKYTAAHTAGLRERVKELEGLLTMWVKQNNYLRRHSISDFDDIHNQTKSALKK